MEIEEQRRTTGAAHAGSKTLMRQPRNFRTSPRHWVPFLPLTAVAFVFAWLNQTPWWGWALVAVCLAALGLTVRWWLRGPALLQVGAWLLAGAFLSTTAVLAHPSAQHRTAGGTDPRPSETVPTQEGAVRGVLNDERDVEIFAGIPYAQPPVGERRWRPPQPPEPHTDLLIADRFSDAPIQATSTFFTRALSQVVEAPLEATLLNPYPVSEDSLYLNIWRSTRPASAKLPVIVYIPGGGFTSGSGALPLYDGESLASRGEAITVTINYRLGVLGFLSHPVLAEESKAGASGNYGMLDQIAALKWVRQNIAAFGGDPDRVTIAGESAGGESVCILGATPRAEGLVGGIIGSSGACMGTRGNTERGDQYDTKSAAEAAGRRLSEELGGATMEEMRRMPVGRVVDAAESQKSHWRPSIDGYVLNRTPAEIYAAGDQLDVPTLIGSNADEASLALVSPPDADVDAYQDSVRKRHGADAELLRLYPGDTEEQVLVSLLQAETDKIMTRAMRRWATLQTRTGEADTYVYYFAHVPPDDDLQKFGAYHGAEVMYAYDNLGKDGNAEYVKRDYTLRDQMSGYWINFARTGNPNGLRLPSWPTMRQEPEKVMKFDAGSAVAPRPRPDAVDFWMRYDGPLA
ncbi:carboxylesterase family protein [Streptomyces sp. NPDC058001]|uniref:carboxylesterase family protein n=1 Tax=Streptomyces sp. NPDC058001 TaxID=3346300 RepID=UPI0036E58470